jgi:hypothetical protein
MKKPAIRYLVASPAGDVPVDTQRLDYPLEADPLKTPYRIYFRAITDFLKKRNFQPLLEAVNNCLGTNFNLSELNEIIVRTEKHGALYHPASIECMLKNSRIKFGLNVAVSDTGKDSLRREFAVLKTLHSRFNFPYIPIPYHLDELHAMVFLLEEWFEGYHEFHITKIVDSQQQVKLWEYGRGDRFLTPEQSFEIYRQIAMILTLYYDIDNYRMIFPWHHAAGDFVVRIEDIINSPSPVPSPQGRGNKTGGLRIGWGDNPSLLLPLCKGRMGGVTVPSPLEGEGKGEGYMRNKIDVRLTTVRGYEPFMGSDTNEMINPVLALFYFLLHLTIQMRLDKLDGVGDIAWVDDSCVDATIRGFFEGLKKKKGLKDCCGSVESFLMLLKSFTKEDLVTTIVAIAEQFEQTKDYRVIQKQLKDHADRLHLTLRNYP